MWGWRGPVGGVGGGLESRWFAGGWAEEWCWSWMAAEAEGARVTTAETGKGTGRKTGGSKVNLGDTGFWRWRRGRWFR